MNIKQLKGDLFGGLTAGIVALPLALAFGEQTALGAVAGLYGAIALSFLAAVFGGTKTQISGPTAPMTVVSAVVIAQTIELYGSIEAAFPVIVATFVLTGVLQIVFGLLRAGSFIRYIPYPVVSGFMSGIGVIIIISQIFPFFGVKPPGGTLSTLQSLHQIPEILNPYAICLALAALIIIYMLPRLTKAIPAALVALIALTFAAYFFIPVGKVLTIASGGAIPSGLPPLHLDFFGVFMDMQSMIVVTKFAFTLAALGAIDSLLTSVVADNLTKTKHNSKKELIGQGIGNIGSALIGGLPGAGATMRTVINIHAGGRSQLSGVVAGLLLLAVLLGLGSYVGFIPNPVLAGILISVGISIIDYKAFRHFRIMPRGDVAIMLVVLSLTVFVDLLIAVAVGVVLAALIFMRNISRIFEERAYTESLQSVSREQPWVDEITLDSEIAEQIYIKHLNGPLFFGFAERFKDLVKSIPKVKVVIIRMERVPYIDQTGLYTLEDAILELQGQNVKVMVTGLRKQPQLMLESIRIKPDLVPEELFFKNFSKCIAWLDEHHEDFESHRNLKTQSSSSQKLMTPEMALDYLKLGNERFVRQKLLKRDVISQLKTTTTGQYPFAAILSCIDSRVPVELLFDQGIGDIFNTKIAGNFVNNDILGSLEFACKLAGSRLILVLGHTECGAIKGACSGAKLGNLTQMLEKIEPAVALTRTKSSDSETSKAFVDQVVKANVELAIDKILRDSQVLSELAEAGEIIICGAVYHINSGEVEFLPIALK